MVEGLAEQVLTQAYSPEELEPDMVSGQIDYWLIEWSDGMASNDAAAVEQLGRLCTAGQERIDRHGSLDPRYLNEIILPELGMVMEHVSTEILERHLVPTETEGATLQVTHYTSLAAVTAMLRGLANGQGATLRVYDSSHSNDPDEGNHLVRQLSSNGNHRWLEQGSGVGHAYITSFVLTSDDDKSDMSDDLVFWRTYGRDGKGCSLTVDVRRQLLRKVLYEPDDVEAVRITLLPVLDVVTPLAQADEDCARAISRTIWKRLVGVRYLYKDKAYHHEQEYRVVIPGDSPDIRLAGVRFETCEEGGSIVEVRHYCEISDLDLRELLASNSRLILGPSVNDRYSVRLYFEDLRSQARADDRGLYGFPIQESQIRYRGR